MSIAPTADQQALSQIGNPPVAPSSAAQLVSMLLDESSSTSSVEGEATDPVSNVVAPLVSATNSSDQLSSSGDVPNTSAATTPTLGSSSLLVIGAQSLQIDSPTITQSPSAYGESQFFSSPVVGVPQTNITSALPVAIIGTASQTSADPTFATITSTATVPTTTISANVLDATAASTTATETGAASTTTTVSAIAPLEVPSYIDKFDPYSDTTVKGAILSGVAGDPIVQDVMALSGLISQIDTGISQGVQPSSADLQSVANIESTLSALADWQPLTTPSYANSIDPYTNTTIAEAKAAGHSDQATFEAGILPDFISQANAMIAAGAPASGPLGVIAQYEADLSSLPTVSTATGAVITSTPVTAIAQYEANLSAMGAGSTVSVVAKG